MFRLKGLPVWLIAASEVTKPIPPFLPPSPTYDEELVLYPSIRGFMHACITFTENRSGGKEVRHLGRSAELTLDALARDTRSKFIFRRDT